MLKLFSLFFSCWISVQLNAQNIHQVLLSDYNPDSLKNIYSHNKKFIPQYELQSLVAMSFYPELKDCKITFKLAGKESVAKTTMTFFSVFNYSVKHFIIYINNNESNTGLLLQGASFNGQVGAIGHELAHVSNFKNKSFLQMALWGIRYISKKNRIQIERRTDETTIEHRLGWQLYDFVDFVLNHSSANDFYKNFKKKYYLQPNEILQLINKYH